MSDSPFNEAQSGDQIAVRAKPDPMGMLQTLVDRGAGAAELRELTDLVKDWKATLAREAYIQAMVRVQQKLQFVLKDARNEQTSSNYARLDTILLKGKPIWTAEGFALTFGEAECGYVDTLPGEKPGESRTLPWKRTTVAIQHVGGHVEHESIDLPMDGIGPKGTAIGSMNRVQGAMSTGTYAQRALICRIFNIAIAGQDLDGNFFAEGIGPGQTEVLNEMMETIRPPVNLRKMLEIAGIRVAEDEQPHLGLLPATQFWPTFRLLNERLAEGKRFNEAETRQRLGGK